MTKMELIKANREKYHKAFTAYEALPEGLEKNVTMSLILPWIKGTNWLGGLSDRIANRELEKLILMGYELSDIENEFNRQMDLYS